MPMGNGAPAGMRWVTEKRNAQQQETTSLESSLKARWPRFVAQDYLKGITDPAPPYTSHSSNLFMATTLVPRGVASV